MSKCSLIPTRGAKEPLQEKICKFCGKKYQGTGKSNQCVSCRESKKSLEVYKQNNKTKKEEQLKASANKIIEHKYTDVVKIECSCALPGCQNKFTLSLFPKVFVYPKYCSEHLNAYKREIFLKKNS